MIGTGLALAAASLGGTLAQTSAANKANKTTAKAADAATTLQRDQFNQTTATQRPFVEGGTDAFSAMLYNAGLGAAPTVGANTPAVVSTGSGFSVGDKVFTAREAADAYAKTQTTGGTTYGGYSASPMAKYLMETGVDTIEGSRAAAGGLYSGATLKAMEDNRRTVVQSDTGDYYARLMQLAGMGQAGASNQAAAGQNYANSAGQIGMNAANQRAQNTINTGNAIAGGIGDMAGIYGYFSNPMAAYGTSANPAMFGGGR